MEMDDDEEFFEVPQDGYIWETDSFTPSTGLGLRDEEFYEVPQDGYIWETDSFTPSTSLGLEDEEFYEVPQDGDIWEIDSFTPSTGLGHREECLPCRGFKYWPSWRIFEYWLPLRIISGLDFDTTGSSFALKPSMRRIMQEIGSLKLKLGMRSLNLLMRVTLCYLTWFSSISPYCIAGDSPFWEFSKPDGGDWPQNLTPRSTPAWILDFHLRGADNGQLKMSFGDEMEADLGFFGGRRLIYDGPYPFLAFSRSADGRISEEGKEKNTLISGTNATIGLISEEGKGKNNLNSSTNSTHGWILEEGKKKSNLLLGNDDFEESAKDREYTTTTRSKKTYEKLRAGIPPKKAAVEFKLIFMVVILFFNIFGGCSSHENHKGNEQCYGHKLIYETQSKVNNSESYEDHTRTDVGHSSITKHFKNGENDAKLRFLVPSKNTFPEFVKVDHDPEGNSIIVTGYAIDVFKEVMNSLAKNVSFEFFACENGSYDELIQLLLVNGCDGVVGDITITSNRSKYGEFTQPYMMAGVSMIVPVVGSRKSWWWFLRPCTAGLWGLMLGLCLSKMFMVWFIENCENNPALQGGTFSKQVRETLFLSLSVFPTSQNEKLKGKCSILLKSILTIELVVFTAFYYPALQPMVSSNNGGPIVTGVEKLIMNGDYVGYKKGSFVPGLLKDMGFQEEKLKAYSSIEEYATALSRGSRNNGVSAIIAEIPYIELFLTKHDDRYTMAGPTFRPDSGFGFICLSLYSLYF